MAIPGLNSFPERVIIAVDKRVRAIVELLKRLNLVNNEEALTEHVAEAVKALPDR